MQCSASRCGRISVPRGTVWGRRAYSSMIPGENSVFLGPRLWLKHFLGAGGSMDSDDKLLARMLGRALSGEGAHVSVNNAVEGLDWKLAGAQREGVAHSVFAVV